MTGSVGGIVEGHGIVLFVCTAYVYRPCLHRPEVVRIVFSKRHFHISQIFSDWQLGLFVLKFRILGSGLQESLALTCPLFQ